MDTTHINCSSNTQNLRLLAHLGKVHLMIEHGKHLLLFLEWFEPAFTRVPSSKHYGKPRWWDPVMRDMPLLKVDFSIQKRQIYAMVTTVLNPKARRDYTHSHEVVCAEHVEAVRFVVPANGEPQLHWVVDTSGECIFDEVIEPTAAASSTSEQGSDVGSDSGSSGRGAGSSSSGSEGRSGESSAEESGSLSQSGSSDESEDRRSAADSSSGQ